MAATDRSAMGQQDAAGLNRALSAASCFYLYNSPVRPSRPYGREMIMGDADVEISVIAADGILFVSVRAAVTS
jgi:hypothetical protein